MSSTGVMAALSERESSLAFRAWSQRRPEVLLIHGLGDGSFVWNCVARALMPRASMAIDLRGHGDSPSAVDGRYHASVHTADVLRVIKQHALTDLTVVGHSIGATIAAHVAAEVPSCVRKLIIVEGGPDADARAATAMLQRMKHFPRRFGSVEEFQQMLLDWHPFATLPVLQEYATCALRSTAAGDYEVRFDPAILENPESTSSATLPTVLGSLQCPTLLARGATSAFFSQARAIQICSSIPNCRLVTIPRAGHAVPIDNPAGLHAAIHSFLDD